VPKLARNQQRNAENLKNLAALGWQTLIIWECETKDLTALTEKVTGFLAS
jgi:DNA mismatch endonuclease (patch repair protein)